MKEYGIRVVSTPFDFMKQAKKIQGKRIGFDSGILVVDRGTSMIPWYATTVMPEEKHLQEACLGLHWPNLLHMDPRKNDESIDPWIAELKKLKQNFKRILSFDSTDHAPQLACYEFTDVCYDNHQCILDFKRFLQYLADTSQKASPFTGERPMASKPKR